MQDLRMKLTFEEIFSKLDRGELVIVHTKVDMKPYLLDPETQDLIEVPEGYLAYDKHHIQDRKYSLRY